MKLNVTAAYIHTVVLTDFKYRDQNFNIYCLETCVVAQFTFVAAILIKQSQPNRRAPFYTGDNSNKHNSKSGSLSTFLFSPARIPHLKRTFTFVNTVLCLAKYFFFTNRTATSMVTVEGNKVVLSGHGNPWPTGGCCQIFECIERGVTICRSHTGKSEWIWCRLKWPT